ncbi:hypothetical protein [Kibdelosporangium philippinense]|uniref:hypothetical protein n=1 Tax=Kibdelosporangium philippinense TaxID=211113 RepID=UPI00360B1E65
MLGAGVFRQLTHIVDPDAPSIQFDGVPLWFARCGAVCVLIDDNLGIDRNRCSACDQATRRQPQTPRSTVDVERKTACLTGTGSRNCPNSCGRWARMNRQSST